ncbi:unnamed protein product [Linum trigynum]|uniref:Uncharacterized protein n=1 Tax=Linum trigynum TaxID=586398 RepID=A0AAV2DAK3_9ROSI
MLSCVPPSRSLSICSNRCARVSTTSAVRAAGEKEPGEAAVEFRLYLIGGGGISVDMGERRKCYIVPFLEL